MDERIFFDRIDAGRRLAEKLEVLDLHEPLVLGIPRGGMIVGGALADGLHAELDAILARKLGAPYQPELAIGAIDEGGHLDLNPDAEDIPGVDDDYLAAAREFAFNELKRQQRVVRRARLAAPVGGRSVIVTDDGIATGSTMIAALAILEALDPLELIVAVPVAPAAALISIRERCDRLICLEVPEVLFTIGQFYRHFDAVSDEDVVAILEEHSAEVR